jgi:hypothetical protein
MKAFVVYDLDSKMPVAVGEQVTAETARYCASVATGIFHANLFAEEIDLEKKLPTSPESGTGKRKASILRDDHENRTNRMKVLGAHSGQTEQSRLDLGLCLND